MASKISNSPQLNKVNNLGVISPNITPAPTEEGSVQDAVNIAGTLQRKTAKDSYGIAGQIKPETVIAEITQNIKNNSNVAQLAQAAGLDPERARLLLEED